MTTTFVCLENFSELGRRKEKFRRERERENEEVRSVARVLQARMESELAIHCWIRNHRRYHHQILT